jgi:hypothetical protein
MLSQRLTVHVWHPEIDNQAFRTMVHPMSLSI